MWPRIKYQVVDTDDFRKAMEAASGKDLKWFFDQWVYKAGHPELKVRWHYEDADKTVRVQVQQMQRVDDQTPLFRLPTTLEITEDEFKTQMFPIVIDGASHEFRDPGRPAKPKMVQIDPRGWLIKELDFEKPRRRKPVPARTRLDACWAGWRRPRRSPRWPRTSPRSSTRPGRGLEAGESDPGQTGNRSSFWLMASESFAAGTDRCGQEHGGAESASPRSKAWPSSIATTQARPYFARLGRTPRKPTVHAGPHCEGWSNGKSRMPTICWPPLSRSRPIVIPSPPRHWGLCWISLDPRHASWPRFTADMASHRLYDLEPSALPDPGQG